MNITISKTIKDKLPTLRLHCIRAKVEVEASTPTLLSIIKTKTDQIHNSLKINEIHNNSIIESTREAYRILGKKPSRYRPSAEALTRRVVQGKGLYQVNNLVDLLNLVSISSGFSIGGYDVAKIEGEIRLGIGEEKEPYQAIGRGELNIANLPLLRDDLGAFGSPTSDSERTSVTMKTTDFLMVFFDFGQHEAIREATVLTQTLLAEFAATKNADYETWSVS